MLKNICNSNNWKFTYARKDFQNLYDDEVLSASTPYIFLDPVIITENFDEFNNVESTNFSGAFMMLLSSDIDEEDYEYRYQTYIKPILNSNLSMMKNEITCNGNYSIDNWRLTEVINAFDFNADGVIVNYSING
ncbi:hypothetical protein [Corallibacter sp.]|uniref:hypothetical protein n=1 Tax=Corallibacter sp. TaxID=2038084 RepID=UPI003AB1C2CB